MFQISIRNLVSSRGYFECMVHNFQQLQCLRNEMQYENQNPYTSHRLFWIVNNNHNDGERINVRMAKTGDEITYEFLGEYGTFLNEQFNRCINSIPSSLISK